MRTLDILATEIFDCERTYRGFCEAIGCEGGRNLIECSLISGVANKFFIL